MTTTSSDDYAVQADGLAAPFPPEAIKSRTIGKTSLSYVPISEVIARMNLVMGVASWSVDDLQAWRDDVDTDWILARAVILVHFSNGESKKCIGYGGQKINATKSGPPVDLGNDYKGASSDAIKKALQQVGVALDLARDEAMLEYEADVKSAASEAELDSIDAMIASLDEASKKKLKEFWAASIGRSLRSGRFTSEDAKLVRDFIDGLSSGGD